ncbi:hypothetical protein HYH03_005434 [Edaphochlamys debaryana]|uniref:Protein kinase domain-containing protein n=1 Tax=Edaphochlamys debaryana TaxID=47281 RepID=A0A835Y8A7_9CHLO|nr:hypothetical protein HYH03_005434 [Edaphochlamys debaryana]|eukprot:KAG2496613.1 hypothetical protein HYH03_005434 [Edaphochlamys debaryana]
MSPPAVMPPLATLLPVQTHRLFVQTCSVDEDSYDDDGGGAFMQLAASVGLAGATGGGRAESEAAPCSCHAQVLEATGASSALLRQAVVSKAPGVHRPERAESYAPKSLAADAAGVCSACGRALGGTQGGADVYSLDATGPDTTFAVVPLAYGQGTMGVLWIAFASAPPAPAQAQGPATAAPSPDGPTASPGSSKAAPALPALLGSLAALQHLAISASMALAAGADDPMHLRWLAGSLRRLHASASLAELVGVLCGTLAHYVRRRFLLEVAAQAALAPGANAKVAFMLRGEGAHGPSRCNSRAFLRFASVASNSNLDMLTGARASTVASPNRFDLLARGYNSSATPPPAHPGTPSTGPAGRGPVRQKSNLGEPFRAERAAAAVAASACVTEGGRPFARPPSHSQTPAVGPRDVYLLDGSSTLEDLRATGFLAPGTAPTGPSLSARPFRLSNTLLQAMMGQPGSLATGASVAAASASPFLTYGLPAPSVEGGVLAGLCVRDCARHVQDERQPSRDVMMLGSGGAQSLVLVGMEAGEGAVLGVYLAFPTPTTAPLLEVVREGCSALLAKVLASHVRSRLRSPELASEWETLLAGVPGAYVSVSRSNRKPSSDRYRVAPPLVNHSTDGLHGQPPAVAVAASRSEGPEPLDKAGAATLPDRSASAGGQAVKAGSTPSKASSANDSGCGGTPATPGPAGEEVRSPESAAQGAPKVSGPGPRDIAGSKNTSGSKGLASKECPAAATTAAARARPVRDMLFGASKLLTSASSATSASLLMSSQPNHLQPAAEDATGSDEEEDDGWMASATNTNAAPTILTVHDLEDTYESWGMRAQMGALVESIMSTTLRSNDANATGDGLAFPDHASRATEGLEELQLSAVLGQGASGVVLQGTLGCAPVAVKLIEMPDADPKTQDTAQATLPDGSLDSWVAATRGAGTHEPPPDTETRARRDLLRNAMEVAVMRSVCHVNILQALGFYDNVVMERHEGQQGTISLRRVHKRDAPAHQAGSKGGVPTTSPICTAIVMELCDRGSLAELLHNRSFPALPAPPPHPTAAGVLTAGAAMQYARYWKGVYMTLLEVALALRYLHARRLVHRDLKPGNVLLRSNPGDTRGWTCKLADFGFALVLDQLPEEPPKPRQEEEDLGGLASGLRLGLRNGSSSGNPTRGWFTVQQQPGGTVTHMAPEAFRKGARIDASVDVFSFGVIMWELVCGRGRRPYRELALEDIQAAVVSGARPAFPASDTIPRAFRQLATLCWSAQPQQRPSAAELVTVVKGMLAAVKS